MEILKMKRCTDGGDKYLGNAIAYVRPDKEGTVAVMGYGVDCYKPLHALGQMRIVRKYFGKSAYNPLIHFIICYDGCVLSVEEACRLTREIVADLAESYQMCIAIHNKDRDAAFYHAHVVMNAVSYKDGKLFHSGFSDLNEICRKVSDVTGRCCKLVIEENKKQGYQEKWYKSAEEKQWERNGWKNI